MRRKRVVALVLLLVAVAAGVAVFLDPAARVQGWVRGEPFFQGRSATAWERDLREPEGSRSSGAMEALAAGQAGAVPVCAWILRTASESQARWRAADALARMGKAAAPAGPELVAALADPDPLVRGVAVRAVGELAPHVPEAVSSLLRLFPDIEAIRTVARFGPAAGGAVPALTELLKHTDATVRRQAVRTLGKIGVPSLPALPELIRLTGDDPDPGVREQSAEAIGDIGPAAADGIPALVKALKDEVPRVRRDAVRALGQMGPAAKGVLAEVRAATNDPDADVKTAATRAVRLIDPAAADKK
jgi:HEAT repeat protein